MGILNILCVVKKSCCSPAAQEVLIDIGEEAGVSPTQVPAALTAAATEALVASAVASTLQAMPQRQGSMDEEERRLKEEPGVRKPLKPLQDPVLPF